MKLLSHSQVNGHFACAHFRPMAAARLGDLTSERAERIVQRVAQRERFAPTEQTRAEWARQRRRTPRG